MEKFCQRGVLESKNLSQLSPVLCDSNFQEDFVVYDVCRGENQKEGLRYDLTRIHPRLLNGELAKTFGHYHLNNEPELYEVLSGEALFFIQRYGKNPLIIEEAFLIEGREREKIIIPPHFSMTTINKNSTRDLIAGNWVSAAIKNEYGSFQKTRGAAYYIVLKENGEIITEKNKNYQQVPELVKLRPKALAPELNNLEFLLTPEKYANFLTIDNLYLRL